MIPQYILLYHAVCNIGSVDSPAFSFINTISIILCKSVIGFFILKTLSYVISFYTQKIKQVYHFFKRKIKQSSDEGDTWILVLLGFGVLFLALGLLLKDSLFAIGFLWGGAIILGGFLLGFCIGSINGN